MTWHRPARHAGGSGLAGFRENLTRSSRLAVCRGAPYFAAMIRIRFTDENSEIRGLGYLAGRFSFTACDDGRVLVAEAALARLARQGIAFTAEGAATYAEQIAAFRNPPAVAV